MAVADSRRSSRELAELLQCGVIDVSSRNEFPTRHPLNQTNRAGVEPIGAAMSSWAGGGGFLGHPTPSTSISVSSSTPLTSRAKIISISSADLS